VHKSIRPMTVDEFQAMFPDEEAAWSFFEWERWKGHPRCPNCGSRHCHTWNRSRKKHYYKCNKCQKLFNVKTESVFSGTHFPLHKWLWAWYYLIIHRKGISSTALSLHIGLSQPATWRLKQKICKLMGVHKIDYILRRISEGDEEYVGGAEGPKHAKKKLHGNWWDGKEVVFGLRERGGYTITNHVQDSQQATLEAVIKQRVAPGTTIYTDGHPSYRGLPNIGYQHDYVNHRIGQYVKGDVHTNSIESVWALHKRAFYGTYQKTPRKYLQLYLNEFDFRLNTGNLKNSTMSAIKMLAADCWQPCRQGEFEFEWLQVEAAA